MPLAYRIVALQAAGGLAGALGFLFLDIREAQAALVAVVVCVLPAAYFAWRANRERSPERILRQGALKFALTIGLMAGAFATLQPRPLGFFCTLVLMQAMYVVGPAVWGTSQRGAPPGTN